MGDITELKVEHVLWFHVNTLGDSFAQTPYKIQQGVNPCGYNICVT